MRVAALLGLPAFLVPGAVDASGARQRAGGDIPRGGRPSSSTPAFPGLGLVDAVRVGSSPAG